MKIFWKFGNIQHPVDLHAREKWMSDVGCWLFDVFPNFNRL